MGRTRLYKPELTDEQKENFCKLATHLQSLPKDYEQFEMSGFLDGVGEHERNWALDYIVGRIPQINRCDTVACAAGHGPAAGITPLKQHLSKGGWHIDWASYCADHFTGGDDTVFEWCFGGGWADEDNTAYGAAARIRYMLDKGGVPIESDYGWDEDETPDVRQESHLYRKYLIKKEVPLSIPTSVKRKELEPA